MGRFGVPRKKLWTVDRGVGDTIPRQGQDPPRCASGVDRIQPTLLPSVPCLLLLGEASNAEIVPCHASNRIKLAPKARVTGTTRSSTQTILLPGVAVKFRTLPHPIHSCEVNLKALGSCQSPPALLVPGPKTSFNLDPWKPSSHLEGGARFTCPPLPTRALLRHLTYVVQGPT